MSDKGLTEALKSPQAMDAYLEVNSAQEIIDDIRAVSQPERTLRAELWMRVYAGIAASAGGSSDAALRWADRAVEQFDQRFKPVSHDAPPFALCPHGFQLCHQAWMLPDYCEAHPCRDRNHSYGAGSMKFSAQNLCRVLRDRSLWPEGFVWNYAEPSCCAMGLSRCIFNVRAYSSSMGKLLGISDEAAHHIFIGATSYMLRNKRGFFMHRDVTPEHIACLIEEFCGIEPSKPVSFTAGAPDDSERWDNRRKVVEHAAALRAIEAQRGQG